MKQVFKRFLSLALAMLMVLTLLPAMTPRRGRRAAP